MCSKSRLFWPMVLILVVISICVAVNFREEMAPDRLAEEVFVNSRKIKMIKMIEPAPREGTAKYSPDGRFLAIGGKHHDGKIFWTGECEVYDTKNFNQIARFSLPQWANDVAFSPDSKVLVVASGSYKEYGRFANSKATPNHSHPYRKHPGEIRLCDTDRFHLIKKLTYQHRISCVAFSPDGKLLAVAENKNPYQKTVIHILETDKWQELWSYTGHQYSINSMVFSKDSRQLMSADSIYDRVSDSAAAEERPSGIIPTGSLGIHIVSLKDRRRIKLINSFELRITFNIALKDDGKKLLCATPSGVVIVNLEKGIAEPIRKGMSGEPVYVGIFPNDKYYCLSRQIYSERKNRHPSRTSGAISICEINSSKLLEELRTKERFRFYSLTLSPVGKNIAVSTTAGITIYSYDPN